MQTVDFTLIFVVEGHICDAIRQNESEGMQVSF